MAAGYQMVIFASDLMGRMITNTKFTDLEINRKDLIDQYMQLITVLKEVNSDGYASGSQQRFDIFKVGEDLVKQLTLIPNIDDYLITLPPTALTLPPAMQPKMRINVNMETLPPAVQDELLSKYAAVTPPPEQAGGAPAAGQLPGGVPQPAQPPAPNPAAVAPAAKA
jgi:hypothetical protein